MFATKLAYTSRPVLVQLIFVVLFFSVIAYAHTSQQQTGESCEKKAHGLTFNSICFVGCMSAFVFCFVGILPSFFIKSDKDEQKFGKNYNK
jgi:hypothetical protein